MGLGRLEVDPGYLPQLLAWCFFETVSLFELAAPLFLLG